MRVKVNEQVRQSMDEYPSTLSYRSGVSSGDEIMMINNAMVRDLDLRTLHLHLNQAPIMMILRSSRLLSDKANTTSSSSGVIPVSKNSKDKHRLRSKVTKHIEEANQSRQPIAKIVETSAVQQSSAKAMSNAQRIDQVIFELIETERSYVKVSE